MEESRKVVEGGSRSRFPLHEAWGWTMAARRKLVHVVEEEELRAEIPILRAEAEHEVEGWRRVPLLELIKSATTGTEIDRDSLDGALRIRDEHTQVLYRDAMAVGGRIATLTTLTMLIGIALVVALSFVDLNELSPTEWPAPLLVGLFGLLGGSLSAFKPVSRPGRRYAQEWSRWFVTLSRPFTGGAAALALYPLVLGGFLSSDASGFPPLAALSVAAGFSERVLWKAVAAAGGATEAESPDRCVK